MTSTASSVKDKLFGRKQTSPKPDDTPLQGRVDPPPLTINIPKSQTATPTQCPEKKTTDSSPGQDIVDNTLNQATDAMPQTRPYRERLAQQLGDEYKGVEKYRLKQDDERKKHWKRWGPYLSDRQWVGSWRSYPAIFN